MKFNFCIFIFFACAMLSDWASAKTAIEDDGKACMTLSAEQKIDRGKELLKRSCDFYRGLDSFSGRLTRSLVLKRKDTSTYKNNSFYFQFKRPAYLNIKMLQTREEGQAILSGSDAYYYKHNWRAYVHEKLANLDENFSNQDFRFVTDGALDSTLLQALISNDPYVEIMKRMEIKSYDGLSTIKGKKYHQLTLSTRGVSSDLQIFLSCGNRPWIRQVVPMHDYAMNIMPAPVEQPHMFLTVGYKDMRMNAGRLNHFKPAAGVRQVTHLVMPSEQDPRKLLVGGIAPGINVRTISGGKFVLSRQRGKVIIIEFWATWCPPCCSALPILEEVAKSFGNEFVEFIAINHLEEPAKIKSFLSAQSMNILVGLDPKKNISQRYRVVGIPQTVLIGPDGRVETIHVGLTPNFKEEIRGEIQSIIHSAKNNKE